jgi:hypothetical protein
MWQLIIENEIPLLIALYTWFYRYFMDKMRTLLCCCFCSEKNYLHQVLTFYNIFIRLIITICMLLEAAVCDDGIDIRHL